MNPSSFEEWLLRSFAVGAIGAAFVSLCPANWRVRVRLAVPVVVFGVLLVLSFGFLRPLPRMEVRAPAFLADLTAVPAGWAAPWRSVRLERETVNIPKLRGMLTVWRIRWRD